MNTVTMNTSQLVQMLDALDSVRTFSKSILLRTVLAVDIQFLVKDSLDQLAPTVAFSNEIGVGHIIDQISEDLENIGKYALVNGTPDWNFIQFLATQNMDNVARVFRFYIRAYST